MFFSSFFWALFSFKYLWYFDWEDLHCWINSFCASIPLWPPLWIRKSLTVLTDSNVSSSMLLPYFPKSSCWWNMLAQGQHFHEGTARSWVLILINGNIVIWKNIKLPITCCTIRCLAKLRFYSFIFSKKCVMMELFLFFPDYITKIVLGYWFPKSVSEQLIAKTIVDFNCKLTSGFGNLHTCWSANILNAFWLGLPSVDSLTSTNSWLIKISSLRFKATFFLKHQDSPLFSWFPISHLAWKYMSYAGYLKKNNKQNKQTKKKERKKKEKKCKPITHKVLFSTFLYILFYIYPINEYQKLWLTLVREKRFCYGLLSLLFL